MKTQTRDSAMHTPLTALSIQAQNVRQASSLAWHDMTMAGGADRHRQAI